MLFIHQWWVQLKLIWFYSFRIKLFTLIWVHGRPEGEDLKRIVMFCYNLLLIWVAGNNFFKKTVLLCNFVLKTHSRYKLTYRKQYCNKRKIPFIWHLVWSFNHRPHLAKFLQSPDNLSCESVGSHKPRCDLNKKFVAPCRRHHATRRGHGGRGVKGIW